MDKVVVFERDEGILDLVSYLLREEGYNPISSTDKDTIVKLVHQNKPAAVILDIAFPDEKETELCRKLKSDSLIAHIPIFILSTYSREKEIEELCADVVIHKPFDIGEFVNVIKTRLSKLA